MKMESRQHTTVSTLKQQQQQQRKMKMESRESTLKQQQLPTKTVSSFSLVPNNTILT